MAAKLVAIRRSLGQPRRTTPWRLTSGYSNCTNTPQRLPPLYRNYSSVPDGQQETRSKSRRFAKRRIINSSDPKSATIRRVRLKSAHQTTTPPLNPNPNGRGRFNSSNPRSPRIRRIQLLDQRGRIKSSDLGSPRIRRIPLDSTPQTTNSPLYPDSDGRESFNLSDPGPPRMRPIVTYDPDERGEINSSDPDSAPIRRTPTPDPDERIINSSDPDSAPIRLIPLDSAPQTTYSPLYPDSDGIWRKRSPPLFGGNLLHFHRYTVRIVVNGKYQTFNYTHLRDSCSCQKCVDPSTKQRNIQTSHIPSEIHIGEYDVKDGELIVRWQGDIDGFNTDHRSVYSEKTLASLIPKTMIGGSKLARYRVLWDRQTFDENVPWVEFNDYMYDDAKFSRCMRDLSRYGLVVLSGVPDSREMVEKIATRMGPLRDSFYGRTWDVRSVPQAKNVAYTDQFLNFHMDLLYMNEPPGYQLLHCLRNSCSGGESLFSDAFRVANKFYRDEKPWKYDALSSFPVNYGYKNMGQSYRATWPTFELLPPHERKPNNHNIAHVNYSPPFQAPFQKPQDERDQWDFRMRTYALASKAFAKDIELPSSMYEVKLNPGDCVIFENRRVVHARRAFDTTSGERWLAGAYVDEDALLSQFNVLKEKYPDLWNVPWKLPKSLPTRAKPLPNETPLPKQSQVERAPAPVPSTKEPLNSSKGNSFDETFFQPDDVPRSTEETNAAKAELDEFMREAYERQLSREGAGWEDRN